MAMKYLGDTLRPARRRRRPDVPAPRERDCAERIAPSHEPFARHWFHVRFLLVEGKKMSKSEGNFYTLRDLLLKGYRASAIRFLLLSVPYRHQLNFTFDGLTESTNAVERLRTFHTRIRMASRWARRLKTSNCSAQSAAGDAELHRRAHQRSEHRRSPRRHLRRAPRREHRRRSGQLRQPERRRRRFALLAKFDSIFAVLEDRDAELTRAALAWAEAEGR